MSRADSLRRANDAFRRNVNKAIRHPRTRTGLRVVAAVLVIWAVTGFLVLPHFLRPVVERKLAEGLHRPVTVRGLSLNPFSLSATLEGLEVKDRGGTGPFFALERLYVNLQAFSILRGAPVIRALTLTKPSATIVRNEDGTYNLQDLIDEALKPKPAEKPEVKEKPFRFSINNIRVEGGSVDFDDRLERTKHTVRDLRIGIPFLSNIPSKVEITTQPIFQARVNGTPFSLHGTTKPFSETRETTVDIEFSDMDLPQYFAYAPPSIPWKLTAGRLDAKMRVAFTQPLHGSPALIVSLTAALRKFAAESGGRPLMAWERFDVVVDSFNVFGRKARIGVLKVVRPEVWIRIEKLGEHRILAAFIAPALRRGKKSGAQAPEEPEAAGHPSYVEVAEMGIDGGKVHFDDLAFERPFHALFEDVAVSVKGFSTAPGKAASVEASMKSDAGATVKNTGTASMEPFVLEGMLEIGGVPLKRYAPFYEKLVKFDVDDGVLDLGTKYAYSTGANANSTLSGLTATLKSPRLRKRDQKKPFFEATSVRIAGTSLDLGKHDVVVGEIASAGGVLAVVRGKDGNADLAALMAEPPPGAPPEPPSAPWSVALGRLALDGYTIRIEDLAPDRPARYVLTKTNVSVENFATAPGAKAMLSVRFGLNGKGMASAKGPVGIHPTYADLNVDVVSLDLVPLEPYVLSNFKLSLARAALSARGALTLREGAPGKTSIGFEGKALVADLLAVDETTKLDFSKWDAFSLEGIKAGYDPTFLQLARLAISGLACDVVIEADGTVNLQKVVGKPAPSEKEEQTPEPTATAAGPAPATPAASHAAPSPAAPAAGDKVPIRIDRLTLQGGRIGLADHFIKPNFAATLADLGGHVTGLSTEEGTVAELDLRGSLAGHSPLEIAGRVNPLAATAFADVTVSFKGIDLPPFTPYSGKYAGYTIARGTLTLELRYKLQNRKLSAENRLLVDQFEFGDKVESKDATKLPVRLAVSLLRDKDGLIDLDLPIEGSLDDPKFRLGKVILQVIGNLIGKAATAPFALLGKLVGGKSEELSTIDFAEGEETLDDAAKKKLDALAKALNNRPALKLEATGRFSGDKDREGLQRLRLERKVKAQKLAVLVKKGEAPASVDAVVVSDDEYPTYLEKAYRKEKFKKPSNFVGIPKDIPAPEMESLMLANPPVTDDDLRQLALARANAVKDYLTGSASVEATRIFVLEPGAKPAEPTATARASRVEFSLK